MKQKYVTFVLMLMSIIFACSFNAKAQTLPSFEEYDLAIMQEYEQKQDVHFILDKFYPQNDNSTDYAKTKKAIATAFKAWQQRDEFESSVDYEERLKTKSLNQFYTFCLFYTQYTLRQYEWAFAPIKYDIDKQEYLLEIYKCQDNYVDYEIDKFKVKASVEPSVARQLKQMHDPYSALPIISFYPMQCVANGKFIPTFFVFAGNSAYFDVDNSKYPGAKEITYSAAELGITNKYLAGKICKVNDVWKMLFNSKLEKKAAEDRAKKEKEERERQARLRQRTNDSLAIITYNGKLESRCKQYNDSLIANKHNIEGTRIPCEMLDIKLIEKGNASKVINTEYEACDSRLKQNYLRLTARIEIRYDYNKKMYISFFANEDEFEKYYCKGVNALTIEVENKKLLISFKSFVSTNSNLIQTLNCQNEKPSSYNINEKTYETITAFIKDCKSTKYYDEIVKMLIARNKKMYDEYVKKGSLFGSQIEFYEAYTSGQYKEILKTKKK